MASMIQIRNVPEDLHRRIKARAATAGMSMSEYLLRELRRIIERPTRDELLARIARRSRVSVHPEPAEVIREERERR
jgi:plasmid stability protein